MEQFVKQACDNSGEIMAIAKQKFETDFAGG
jgi:glutathione peroxidase-family protein